MYKYIYILYMACLFCLSITQTSRYILRWWLLERYYIYILFSCLCEAYVCNDGRMSLQLWLHVFVGMWRELPSLSCDAALWRECMENSALSLSSRRTELPRSLFLKTPHGNEKQKKQKKTTILLCPNTLDETWTIYAVTCHGLVTHWLARRVPPGDEHVHPDTLVCSDVGTLCPGESSTCMYRAIFLDLLYLFAFSCLCSAPLVLLYRPVYSNRWPWTVLDICIERKRRLSSCLPGLQLQPLDNANGVSWNGALYSIHYCSYADHDLLLI